MTESLLKQVEHTREKMIKSALDNGVGNVNTIRLSKKLDRLLNVYQLHKSMRNPTNKIKLVKN